MTEAKPDPRPRSAFLPNMLLVVSMVVCAVVVAVSVPLVSCQVCFGVASFTAEEFDLSDRDRDGLMTWSCSWCDRTGAVSLYRRFVYTGEIPIEVIEDPKRRELLKNFLKTRQSSP